MADWGRGPIGVLPVRLSLAQDPYSRAAVASVCMARGDCTALFTDSLSLYQSSMRISTAVLIGLFTGLLSLVACTDSAQQQGDFLQFEGDVVDVSLMIFCTASEIQTENFDTLPQTFDLPCTPEAVQVTGRGTDVGMRLLLDGEAVAEDRDTLDEAEEDDTAFLTVFLLAPGVSGQDAQEMQNLLDDR